MDLYAQVGLIVAGAVLVAWLAKKLVEWWKSTEQVRYG